MARRRSANRRSSMRSLNATELDRDSDQFDANNPMWWKTMEGDITTRPSLPFSIADTTGSILDSDSRLDTAELQDHWWDNLDRTKLSSSRRFSSRRSLNPAETYTDSILSDNNDDMSIKKKRVTLRPRANKSGGSDNFLKAMNESNDTIQSEPLPGKRKSKSPTRSDTEISRKKTRTSRGHVTDASRDDHDNDSMTSNDSDVVVKPRPKAFEKRFTTKLRETMFGNVLQNEEAGTSGTNITKSPSRPNDSPLSKISSNPSPGGDSNDSGLMGPPKGGSLRKRLSTVSRTLNLSSDGSDGDGTSKRARPGLAPKSRKNLSVNPFDEILNEHVEEKISQSGAQTNKRDISEKSPNKSRSSIADEDRTPARLNDSASRREQISMVDLVTPDGEENPAENNRRAISEANKIGISISGPVSVLRDEPNRQSAMAENSRNRIVQDWKSSDSEDDAIVDRPSKSMMNVSKESLSTKTETILSSTRISHSHIDKSIRESDDEEEETAPDKKHSLKSTSHRRTFADSAYSLPDKERSDSPIISLSENEDDRSLNNSKRNKLGKMRSKKSADRSISREPSESNVSRKSSSRANTSRRKINSDESISDQEIPHERVETREAEEKSSNEQDAQRRISKSSNLSAKEKVSPGRKNSSHENVSGQRLESEEENDHDSEKNHSKLANSSKRKTNPPERSTARGNVSRQIVESDDSEDEVADSQKPNPSTAKEQNKNTHLSKNSSITQHSTKMQSSEKTDEKSSKRESHVDDENTSRKNVANISARQTLLDDAISEDEAEKLSKNNSKSSSFTVKKKSATARKSISYGNKSRNSFVSDESTNNENAEDAKKSTSMSTKRNPRASAISSPNRVEFDEPISEEEARSEDSEKSSLNSSRSGRRADGRNTNAARNSFVHADDSGQARIESGDAADAANSKSANLDARRKARAARNSSANVSAQLRESAESVSEEDGRIEDEREINSKAKNFNAEKKSSTAGESNRKSKETRGNISGRSVQTDESSSEENAEGNHSKSVNISALRNNTSHKSSARGNVSGRSESKKEGDKSKKLENLDVEEKSSKTERSTARGNVSRQIIESDDSEDEVPDSQKPNPSTAKEVKKGTRLSKNSSIAQETIKMQIAEKTDGRSTKRDFGTDDKPSTSRKMLANKSPQQTPPDDSISEEEVEEEAKNNSFSTSFTVKKKSGTAIKSTSRENTSQNIFVSEESTDDDEAQDAERSTSKSLKRSFHANTSSSRPRIESDESISEEEEQLEDAGKSQPKLTKGLRKIVESSSEEESAVNNPKSINIPAKGKMNTSRTSAATANVSRQRIESDIENNDDGYKSKRMDKKIKPGRNTTHGKVTEQRAESNDSEEEVERRKDKKIKPGKSTAHAKVSEQGAESVSEEEVEVSQPPKPLTAKDVNKSTRPPKNSSITRDATGPKKSTLSTVKNFEAEDSTVDSEAMPPTTALTKKPTNQLVPAAGKSNVFRTQRNITDFLQSKFTQKFDDSRATSSFDQDRLKLVREEMESIKQQEIKALRIDVTAKKKETRRSDNALKVKQLRRKENNLPRPATKPARVVDKAFIVNGTVYKRPKLPRPKPWVTDRLYRHLWQKMEPKFGLSTRTRSEKFVEQLAEVVAVTIRRKKYDSYRLELEALMKEMARLGVIKTRNDFYDFCYDFLPYDFRVKATPILMPGNVQNIPYDPETLHTPILAESSRSG